MLKTSILWGLAVGLWVTGLVSDAAAQRKITPKKKERGPAVTQYLGAVTSFNHITGAVWEIQLSQRGRLSPRSSFSVVGGYSSRWVTFKNDTLGRPSRDRWLSGLGGAVMMNNYLKKLGEGFVWTLGVSGHLFFERPVDLKTFSVFGMVAHRFKTGSSIISPHIGGGLMGTIFKSTLGSDVNNLYLMAGCAWLFKR